jgi:hypothetical protein
MLLLPAGSSALNLLRLSAICPRVGLRSKAALNPFIFFAVCPLELNPRICPALMMPIWLESPFAPLEPRFTALNYPPEPDLLFICAAL